MALGQSQTSQFKLEDRTSEFLLLPQTWTLLGDSGLFQEEFLSTNTVSFEARTGTLAVVNDQVRGSKPQTVSNDVRTLRTYSTTWHPYTDALYPQDIAGVTRPGSMGQQLDTKDAALVRKLEKARKSFDMTLELARWKTLGSGTAWSPNGTVSENFYTDAGVTKNEVDFVFGTSTTDIVDKCESVIAGFQAAATEGQVIQRVIGYASKAFFKKLIAHAKVQTAYTYYAATEGQSILRNRAGGMGLYRTFSFAGIDFVEVGTSYKGQDFVTSGDCVFVAQDDMGSFVTYYSPAARFGYVNTVAERGYVWTFEDPRMTEITIEAEMSMLNVLRQPGFVARGYSST